MIERIVVPLDGSKLAEMALPHAVALARATGYRLTLLRVVNVTTMESTAVWGLPPAENMWEGWDEELKVDHQYLKAIAKRLLPMVDSVDIKLLDDPPEAGAGIISFIERHPEVALVVMSTHGRSGPGRWVFGSVAEKVLHASPVPLLLVRPKRGEELPADLKVPAYKSVLVPLDGSVFAAQALGMATTLATTLHAKVMLMSSVPERPIADVLIPPPAIPEQWTDEGHMTNSYLEQNQRRLEDRGLTVETILEYGPPANTILRVAEVTHPDLIVMATHGRSGLARLWLGSIAMKVVQASAHPVLLVRANERVAKEVSASVAPVQVLGSKPTT